MRYDTITQAAVERLIGKALLISTDVAKEVENVLRVGLDEPLSDAEAEALTERVIEAMRDGAQRRGDAVTAERLAGDVRALVREILAGHAGVSADASAGRAHRSILLDRHNGIQRGVVKPTPWFHGKEVPMYCGFAKTSDIQLWDGNERLAIHLGQFQKTQGRDPSPDELLAIMTSKMALPGVSESDEFKIVELARSIASNGVQKPPILDVDGTLLDGNRRVAACYYILRSNEFAPEQKRRADYVFVWQLTEHATEDDRRLVVVSLNFESDFKEDWPDYVKARKVYEDWRTLLALEPRDPGPRREAELKRQLSMRYALGPETSVVNRFIKMIEWADRFEEYQIEEKKRDRFEVKHKANRYFQYFDELAKGAQPGGVAYALNQNDTFRHLVFDLLFEGKFRNWKQIRDLKYIYENEEAREILRKARDESDVEAAEEHMDNASSIAHTRRAESRELGANTRIETFVKWLEELPVRAFRDSITPENLQRLLKALRLVEDYAARVLGGKSVEK